jgi:hypothetical protein
MEAHAHRRYAPLSAAAVAMLAVLACVSPAPAAIAGKSAVAVGRPGAGGAGAAVAATSTRPLCRSGWRLRGRRAQGFVCKRHGHRARPTCRAQQQLRRRSHGYVCLPTPAGSPTPQMTAPTQLAPPPVSSTPAPSPTPGLSKEQYLVNGAFEYAKSYGEKELAETAYTHVYYWKIEPNGCALIGPNTAECVLLLYKEVEVLNYDPSSIANSWFKAIYLLGVYYEYQGPELGYRVRLGQVGDWSVGPWRWL